MDGLECSEIMLSDIDLGDRIDAEYFAKEYLRIAHCLEGKRLQKLGTLVKTTASAFYPAATQLYVSGDTAFVRCVDCINDPIISKEQDSRFEKIPRSFADENKGVSLIKKGEIVITKVGTPCYASIIEDYDEVALSRTVLGLTDIHDIDPYYLTIFLRCRYGFYQLYRQRELTIQYQLTLPRVKAVDIFLPCPAFQGRIAHVATEYRRMMNQSRQLYKEARRILHEYIHYDSCCLSAKSMIEKSFSVSFGCSGRLDAEYYQPKYDTLLNLLNTNETVGSLCHLHDSNFSPAPHTEYAYIELANVGRCNAISKVEVMEGRHLPSRAKRQVRAGQVIVSSIEGSLQSCALIPEEYEGALCSNGFHVLDSDAMNPETLLLLFQSEPIQELMRQRCSGTILTAISKGELLRMPLPLLPPVIQQKIAAHVQESSALRRRAKQSLDRAVRAIEIAIEQDEAAALSFLHARA